ncbi:MAG: hypothetical protein MK209_01640 [Planctomycetes bacterium]|nr:hypothetical protein [Planctomycetota bacterium]
MDKRWTWVGGIAILAVFLFWLMREGAVEASDVERKLSSARFDQDPLGMVVPEPWQEELRAAIARAPKVSLLDAAAPSIAEEVLRSVSWIHPDSVSATLTLPDGVAVDYLPRQARFLLMQRGRPVGVLSADGCLLPPGLPTEVCGQLIQVELEPSDVLPAPGRPVSSRLAQEALRCFFEVIAIEEVAGIQVRRIVPIDHRLHEVRSQAPGLRFLLHDGREIGWGRSDLSRAADEPDSEHKAGRLGSVMRQYPQLAGVQAVELYHDDETLVFDASYRELPFDGVVLRPR